MQISSNVETISFEEAVNSFRQNVRNSDDRRLSTLCNLENAYLKNKLHSILNYVSLHYNYKKT